MTGYTVHTGSTKKFTEGWDNIFRGGKTAAKKKAGKSAKPSAAGKKKKTKRGGK